MPRSRRQTVRVPCKVNLHLGVHAEKDARGYHRVDSVMVPVGLRNTIVIESAPETSISFDPALDDPVRRNATQRAVELLSRELGARERVAIRIERRIPSGGGLGSSSADAGSVLRALAARWDVGPLDQCVVGVARRVGADVAFFLHPVPSLLRGAGDTLEKTFPDFVGVPLVLVMPEGCASSTREVYEEFDCMPEMPESPNALCDALAASDVLGVAENLYNNLAPAALRLKPAMEEPAAWLARQPGVVASQITGSGSCSFAICESADAAVRIAHAAKNERGWWAKAVFTVGLDGQFC
ncbi:4-(cytidine 5'-diphospho)-2-C-methyl-D-erythritol kinase [Olsenella sp. Marseille-P4559]|uniref:4-(cytidine 5'-diphospho)-2-C-methyl-D-erythritol kinase n=1 Tax=Olsenella sp. Marseille-P4559 TaxID=2364795 RepID=UPI00102FB824|nr:4-diphosphocytidyl-2C-methyl-D-erythritol kinase [Olsenella sp. Marseille-P4559]